VRVRMPMRPHCERSHDRENVMKRRVNYDQKEFDLLWRVKKHEECNRTLMKVRQTKGQLKRADQIEKRGRSNIY
jgi:hypothetical protein